jgi:hypothetical protein
MKIYPQGTFLMKKISLTLAATIILLSISDASSAQNIIMLPTMQETKKCELTCVYPKISDNFTPRSGYLITGLKYPTGGARWKRQRNLVQNLTNEITRIRSLNSDSITVCASGRRVPFLLTVATQCKIDNLILENPKFSLDYPFYGFVGKIAQDTKIIILIDENHPEDTKTAVLIDKNSIAKILCAALQNTGKTTAIKNCESIEHALTKSTSLDVSHQAIKKYAIINAQEIKMWWFYCVMVSAIAIPIVPLLYLFSSQFFLFWFKSILPKIPHLARLDSM